MPGTKLRVPPKVSNRLTCPEAWEAHTGSKVDAMRLSDEPTEQLQYFNDWNQDNYRQYKFAVQARYMDWVSNGYKYEVEQNFVSSAL